MKALLLISTLDVAGRRNNREHAALRELGPRYDRVIVVFRCRAPAGKPRIRLLRSGVRRWQDGPVVWVSVDPALNAPEGAVRGATTARPGAGKLRRALGRALDAAAILRDRLTIGALTAAAARELRGLEPGSLDVEAFGPWAAEAARRLRGRGLIRAFAYVDRDYEPGFVSSALRQAWARRMERRAARSADLVLSIGRRLAARHLRDAGVTAVLSPTGVEAGLFDAPPRPSRPLRIAYVGEVAPWSALDVLIEALDHPGLAEARLSVRGPALPGYRAHVQALAAPLGDRFDWPGDVERSSIPGLLAGANLGWCVFRPTPLRVYAAPLKLLEYLAAGLPVLAVPGSEAGDMVQAAGAGLPAAADPLAVRAALLAVQADPAGHAAMSAQAVKLAAEHDWRVIMAREAALLAGLRRADAGAASAVPEAAE